MSEILFKKIIFLLILWQFHCILSIFTSSSSHSQFPHTHPFPPNFNSLLFFLTLSPGFLVLYLWEWCLAWGVVNLLESTSLQKTKFPYPTSYWMTVDLQLVVKADIQSSMLRFLSGLSFSRSCATVCMASSHLEHFLKLFIICGAAIRP